MEITASLYHALPEDCLIAPLLADESVSDILINGTESVHIERDGKLLRTEYRFDSEEQVRALAESIALATGILLNGARPMLDVRLHDGSRVNIVCPPLAVNGTLISIRRFLPAHLSLDEMVQKGNLSPELADFLKIAARCRLNVLISGGTGAGKTTLLDALTRHADDHERIVTIEETAELLLPKPHVLRLETHPIPMGEMPEAQVSTRDLVKNALSMRPDRIVVGEIRGGEAFDLIQAMNTGHEGTLATLHANHPRDALTRLENMAVMAVPNLPAQVLRAQIASAVHLLVQISRMRDGIRRVTYVSEVCGMEGDAVKLQELVQFVPMADSAESGVQGEWRFADVTPRLAKRAAYWGQGERLAQLFPIR